MKLRIPHAWTLLCICLYFNIAGAALLDRRQDPPASTTPSPTPSPTRTRGSDGDGAETTAPPPTDSPVPTGGPRNSTSSTVSSVLPVPTVVNGTGSLNHTLFNSTIPAGELPLAPRVTPGWAVAGVILLLTGAGHALHGIKMQRLHTFLSSAYLAALGTSVLIVYVMTPPVSDAIQGAYVVAVVCTGLVLGGAAMIFPEITEGLGCLLGGFCLSMWLLTMQEGGLVVATSSKVVFIACFTVAAFAFYFSRWTRTYALIGCISFSGATAAVLGIDCFSRAGLKEFWAYIWALNTQLFPLGADTYPLTRGIRVELAATILIFLAGIVSQLKLWTLLKERRAKRDAEKAEGQRHLQQEDETAGRQIEETNADERRQWEAVYGDGERSPGTSGDSGVGDMESVKKLRHSQGTTTTRSRGHSDIGESSREQAEMVDVPLGDEAPPIPPRKRPAAEMVMVQDANHGMVTVRVARDDVPEGQEEDGHNMGAAEKKEWVVGADGEARLATTSQPKRTSKGSTTLNSPGIVPLPFKVPIVEERGVRNDDDRSSVATFADEDESRSIAVSRSSSFAKRLSQSSAELLRSLSQRSKRASSVMQKPEFPSESWEDLVGPRGGDRDDNASLAATVDGMSLDGDDADTIRDHGRPRSIEIKAQLTEGTAEQAAQPSEEAAVATKEMSSTNETGESATEMPSTAEATSIEKDTLDTTPQMARSTKASDEGTQRAKSVASVDSAPASLAKERLPRALSRVAMSYRTNEWAKHLSNAETPQPETLQLADYTQETAEEATTKLEEAAPVNMAELQQTAENANPPPAVMRSASAMSGSPSAQPLPAQPMSRSNSRQSLASQALEPQPRNNVVASASAPNLVPAFPHPFRSMSSTSLPRRPSNLFVQAIPEENDGEAPLPAASPTREGSTHSDPTSIHNPASPIDRSTSSLSLSRPPVPGVVSYSSPQTLLGRRELFLRTKSQGPFPNASAPDLTSGHLSTIPSYPTSDAGSMYNYNMSTGALVSPNGTSSYDMDDLPMSQRKEIIRQSSLMGQDGSPPNGPRPGSVIAPAADAIPFNSHQPSRGSHLPTQAARDAQLAHFRSSVAVDLRAGTPLVGAAGRETPLPGLGLVGAGYVPAAGRDAEVRQSIDVQRSFLLAQKEAEAQRREVERADRERGDRAFEERMRRGNMLEAHRDAMRRLQASARGP